MKYSVWKVNETEYKCRLNAKSCIELEKRLGTNPVNIFVKVANNQEMPSLEVLLTILQCSLQALEHGITMEKVYDLFDMYVDEGKTAVDLIPLIIEIFKTSGFFTEEDNSKN